MHACCCKDRPRVYVVDEQVPVKPIWLVSICSLPHRAHTCSCLPAGSCVACVLHDELVDQREFYSFFNYIYNNYLRI